MSSADRAASEAFLQIFGPFHGDGTDAGWRGIRTAQHTYARYQDKPWVLYDNQRDPYQLHNLMSDPASKSLAASCEKKLSEWMRRTGDSWAMNWSFPVEDDGRLYKDKAYYTVDEYLKTIH